MRIGIVTLFGDNYGNKLQNYALQRLLQTLGCDPETIVIYNGNDYPAEYSKKDNLAKLTPQYILNALTCRFNAKYHRKNQRDGLIRSVLYTRSGDPESLIKKRSDRFAEFSRKHLLVSENSIDADKITDTDIDAAKQYDFFICGSDQVWNRTKSPYFLTFAPPEKRIAFAPSFGIENLPDYLTEDYRKWISEISCLSVREERGQKIIRALTGRSAPLMPDPTVCISADDWVKIEEKPHFSCEKPFVVTYFLGNETNRYRAYIERYAANNSCQIINFFDLREPDSYGTGPSEFVWLIHHAKAVFTDSFHATVFSIIFHKPFAVFNRMESGGNTMRSRIDTLLGTVHLEGRNYKELSVEQIDSIDFSESDKLLALQKEKAAAFLKQSMKL